MPLLKLQGYHYPHQSQVKYPKVLSAVFVWAYVLNITSDVKHNW